MVETNLHYLAFDEIGITMAVIAVALAFIVLVWNAVKAIHDWRNLAKKPTVDRIEDHEKRITSLEECCSEGRGKLASDWEFQQEEKEFNMLMLEAIRERLKHSLDGDDTEGLVAAESKIEKYIFGKLSR